MSRIKHHSSITSAERYPLVEVPTVSEVIGAAAVEHSSRVKVNESFMKSRCLLLSEKVSGRRYSSKEEAIDYAKSRINTEGISVLYSKHRSFKRVLGAEIIELHNLDDQVPLSIARMGREYDTKLHGRIPYKIGMSKAWETGVNIGSLVEARPNDRFKFYFSLDTATPAKKDRAVQFLQLIHERSSVLGISMLTKNQEHTYDNCNLYTWSPIEMAHIIQDLYPVFPDIWNSTEHPLQGIISGIDSTHVGFVQEPIGGHNRESHTGRMGILGASLDAGVSFEDACASAAVLPEAPWICDFRKLKSR